MSEARRRWIYLPVLVCMGLFAYSVGGKVPFFLFAFALSLYLGSAVWLLLAAQGIALIDEINLDERVMVGQDYPLKLTIKNISQVTWPWLTASLDAVPGIEISQGQSHCGVVSPQGRQSFQIQIKFTQRGRYDRLWLRIVLRDLFGLFDQEWSVERRINLTVLPRILSISGQLESAGYPMGVAERDRQLSEDVAQPVGLRQYVHGDSIRRIHWRTTAKTGQLMVRTYAHQSRTQIYLYLDCCDTRQAGQGDGSTFERAVVAAASMANHFLARRIATGLVAAGAPAPFYPARDQLGQQTLLLDALAMVNTISGSGELDPMLAELNAVPPGSVLVLISTLTSDTLGQMLMQLRARQVKLAVIQLVLSSDLATPFVAEEQQPHHHPMIPWATVGADDDLATALRGVAHALLS